MCKKAFSNQKGFKLEDHVIYLLINWNNYIWCLHLLHPSIILQRASTRAQQNNNEVHRCQAQAQYCKLLPASNKLLNLFLLSRNLQRFPQYSCLPFSNLYLRKASSSKTGSHIYDFPSHWEALCFGVLGMGSRCWREPQVLDNLGGGKSSHSSQKGNTPWAYACMLRSAEVYTQM